MSESKIYLEKFINDYNNLFIKNENGELIIKNYDDYVNFLNYYGLINTNKDNYKKINFFKENVNELLSLPKNNANSIWLLHNLDEIIAIFSQIQTDHTVPDQGHYIYKNYEFKQGISASGYLMHFLQKIQNTKDKKIRKFYNSHSVNKSKSPRTERKRFKPYGGKKNKTKKISKNTTKRTVEMITNDFIYNVTKTNDSKFLNNQFCNNGYLIATLSRKTRRKTKRGSMKQYFDYFANLKGIIVLSKHYDIQKISKNIYLNQATVEWKWDAIKEPVVARMTFIIKNNCIFLLHSSSLPPFNKNIK